MILDSGFPLKLSPLHKIANYLISGFVGLGVVCFFIAVWEVGAIFTNELILPHPLGVFARCVDLLENEQRTLTLSLYRAFWGILIAFLLGSILGVLSGNIKTMARILKPLCDILLGIAPIVWIVLALFWFGIGDVSVIFSVIITIFPLSFASALVSVATLSPKLEEVCIIYKLSLFKRVKYYYLPHIAPFMLSSFSVVFAMGIKILIMAELLGASSGVGSKIADARSFLDTTEVLAYMVIMVAIILLFDFLVIKPLRMIVLPWLKDEA